MFFYKQKLLNMLNNYLDKLVNLGHLKHSNRNLFFTKVVNNTIKRA